ncbi:MAG: hypothetical protein OEW33_14730 [Nitrospirota bacterium]|nr:hypothetical protein [Nitrospirota bacterium]
MKSAGFSSAVSHYEEALTQYFPGSRTSRDFVDYSLRTLSPFGFQPNNAMVCASVCRDELTRPFINNIHEVWGRLFNFSSLAGMLYLGVTGFKAAHHHAPNSEGTERYVYFAFPHIAIDENGVPGNCRRPGRHEMSHACGALLNVLQDLSEGSVGLELNQDDLEQSLLKQRLFRKLRDGEIPDLVTLTKIAHSVIREDLERMIQLTVDSSAVPYAVFTGIQIHGPGNRTWIWASAPYVVAEGARENLPH